MNKPVVGEPYRHKNSDKLYEVTVVEKIKIGGVWVDNGVVGYTDGRETYYRLTNDFLSQFEYEPRHSDEKSVVTHACLVCAKSRGWQPPEQRLSSGTVSLCFECHSGVLQGAYGPESGVHTMLFWPGTMTVNVNGGQTIPKEGCPHYKKRGVIAY